MKLQPTMTWQQIDDNITIRVSPDNPTKMGKVPSISTIPVKDCGNCDSCMAECYALKAWKQYPATRKAWKQNSQMFRTDMAQAFDDLNVWITKKAPRLFRIHMAGDFLNQDHVNGYFDLARNNPETKFLAFTKMHDLDYASRPANLEIVFSMFPSMETPATYQDGIYLAWAQDGTEDRIPGNAIECSGLCEDCGMCWSLADLGRDVYFHMH